MAEVEELGISIGGRNISNLRYADDTALIAENLDNRKLLLKQVDEARKAAGLQLNAENESHAHRWRN